MTNPKWTFGLIGHPVEHSFSPYLHATALEACAFVGEYQLFPAPDEQSLQTQLNQMREGRIHGLNITIPWKESILNYLDQVSDTVKEVGAVNTVYSREGQLIGENTDVPGFKEDILTFLSSHPASQTKQALVLGAGGAARAAAFALCQLGWRVTIAARRISQAQKIQVDFKALKQPLQAIELSASSLAVQLPNLLVNATPVGMAPICDESPWPEGLPLPRNAMVYDLIYNPPMTPLLSTAHVLGLPTKNGAGMLVSQAAASFTLWTGRMPPKDKLVSAMSDALKEYQRRKK